MLLVDIVLGCWKMNEMLKKKILKKKMMRELHKRNVVYGKNLVINGEILLSDKLNLELGDNVKINSGSINPVGHEISTYFYTVGDARIVIGNNVGISNTTFVARTGIHIEDDVLIGGGCMIFDTDFHPLSYQSRISNDQSKIQSEPVHICKGAFIGARSLIMKGVTVGEYSVIGAGSVVTKSVPDNEVWAGNPAKFIYKIDGSGGGHNRLLDIQER